MSILYQSNHRLIKNPVSKIFSPFVMLHMINYTKMTLNMILSFSSISKNWCWKLSCCNSSYQNIDIENIGASKLLSSIWNGRANTGISAIWLFQVHTLHTDQTQIQIQFNIFLNSVQQNQASKLSLKYRLCMTQNYTDTGKGNKEVQNTSIIQASLILAHILSMFTLHDKNFWL